MSDALLRDVLMRLKLSFYAVLDAFDELSGARGGPGGGGGACAAMDGGPL